MLMYRYTYTYTHTHNPESGIQDISYPEHREQGKRPALTRLFYLDSMTWNLVTLKKQLQ